MKSRAPSLLKRVAPFFYLFAISMILVGVHVARYHELSPIDELRHVDYVERVSHLQFPHLGDYLGQEAMREEACRGIDLGDVKDPPCDSRHFDPAAFRDKGYQNATFHPPTYYVVAAGFSKALVGLGLFESFVDPARLLGGLLLAAGLMVTYAVGRKLGVSRVALLAVLTLVPILSTVLHSSSTVNPDAASIVAGAAVLLVAVLWERNRVPTWALGVVGAAATAVKFTNFIAVAIVALYFLVRAIPPEWVDAVRRRLRLSPGEDDATGSDAAAGPGDEPLAIGSRRYLVGAAVLVGGALLLVLAWSVIDAARATIDPGQVPQNQIFATHGVPRFTLVFQPNNVWSFFPPYMGYEPTFLDSAYLMDTRTFIVYLFAGALLVQTFRARRSDQMSTLAAVATFVLVFGGPGFVLLQVVFNHILNTAASRYGLSAIPVFVVVVAALARGRVGKTLLAAVALIAFAVTLAALLGTPVPDPGVRFR